MNRQSARVAGETWTLSSVSDDAPGEGETVVIVEAAERRSVLARLTGRPAQTRKMAFLLPKGGEWRDMPSLARCTEEVQRTLSELVIEHRKSEALRHERGTAKAEVRRSRTPRFEP